jgi:hypothetical protein
MTEAERPDRIYAWPDGKGGWTVRLYGEVYKGKAGQPRVYRSRKAAERAGDAHLRAHVRPRADYSWVTA